MKSIKHKVTLSDSLLHFLKKENILGLFLYSVFLVGTHKEYTLVDIYNMPSWREINKNLRSNGLQEIDWGHIASCFNSYTRTINIHYISCCIVNDFGCIESNCLNLSNNICNVFYIPFSAVKYTLPNKKDWIHERP